MANRRQLPHWTDPPPSRSVPCAYCRGRDGQRKARYASPGEAEAQARHIWQARRVELRVYACPHASGWHLTKA